VLKRSEAGPGWYAKDAPAGAAGREIVVPASEGALAKAVGASAAGDIVRVATGTHRVAQPIAVAHPLTVTGPRDAVIESAASTLFQLLPGGSIVLRGATLSGAASPAAAGNALVRAPQSVSTLNYRVTIDDVAVRDLTAPGYDVFAATPATFADKVEIRGSSFARVSGAVVAAAAETGSKGLYSAEQIEIADNSFADVATVADVARLGTDESTFGPRFVMSGNSVSGGGAVRLSGVQWVEIARNRFANAAGVEVANSVGAPVVRIADNRFAATPEPRVTSLYKQGKPDVVLAGNIVEGRP